MKKSAASGVSPKPRLTSSWVSLLRAIDEAAVEAVSYVGGSGKEAVEACEGIQPFETGDPHTESEASLPVGCAVSTMAASTGWAVPMP